MTNLTLKAALEFLKHGIITKEASKHMDLEMPALLKILERKAWQFSDHALSALGKIIKFSSWIWWEDLTVLVHGYSKTMYYLLWHAAENGYKVNVYVTEARPTNSGEKMKVLLDALSINTKLVLDSAVASLMPSIDYVFLGAEAVVENGGIISKIGTFTIALCAKCHLKKVYVFTESLKFLKKFPLNQKDISSLIPKMETHENLIADYTPPEYITMLITDLGISPPSLVADELISVH